MFRVRIRKSTSTRPKDDDLVLEGSGEKGDYRHTVSLPFLADATIDFTEELIGARFCDRKPECFPVLAAAVSASRCRTLCAPHDTGKNGVNQAGATP